MLRSCETHMLWTKFCGALEVRTLRENSITILRYKADLSWNRLKCFSQVDLEAFFKKTLKRLTLQFELCILFISSCIKQ